MKITKLKPREQTYWLELKDDDELNQSFRLMKKILLYAYTPNSHLPWYDLWRHSQLIRDVQWIWQRYRHRRFLKIMLKYRYTWNHQQKEWAEEYLKTEPLIPRYKRIFNK